MTPGPGDRFDHLLKGMKSRVESLDSIVKTEESGVNQEPKSQLNEKVDSRVESLDSIVKTEESRVNQEPKSQLNEKVDSRVESLDSIVKTEESRTSVSDPIVKSLDNTALEEAIKEASKKPKLGVYSPLAAAMLRYKAITTPRYSMGSELRLVIEQALKEAYPQLYDEVRKRMEEG